MIVPRKVLKRCEGWALNRVSNNASLRGRETRFCGAETKAPKPSLQFNLQIAEIKCVHKSRQFGAIRTDPGNPHLRRTAWWGWEDSNLQPNNYQPLELNH